MAARVGPGARRLAAAIDVGSNSIHLLVAELAGRWPGVERSHVHEESVLLGLGRTVDAHGVVPRGERQAVLRALIALRRVAAAKGAQLVTFLGTEPLRRASNAAEMCREVEHALGQALHVIDELAEAQLTYLGVTGGRPPNQTTIIVDIGGGSTEVVIAGAGRPARYHSLASGSARLGNGIVVGDHPTPSELDRLRLAARSLVDELPRADAAGAIFVGGTATNIVKLVPLSRAGFEAARALLSSLAVDDLTARYRVNVLRARQLPAGALIAEAILEHFALESAEVSQASLRDGAILARDVLGAEWPRRLASLVGGTQGVG